MKPVVIFIYGPPAAGKLTVANELSKLTGYAVFHNHMAQSILTPLFPYEDEHLNKVRSQLSKQIRMEIFTEAVANGVSFITTFGAAGSGYFDFFRAINQAVEEKSGKMFFVQLLPTTDALLSRVEESSRKAHGKIDSKEFLLKRLTDRPDTLSKYPDVEHLRIDNTNISAHEAAKMITQHYGL